jgi:hypothetical protein
MELHHTDPVTHSVDRFKPTPSQRKILQKHTKSVIVETPPSRRVRSSLTVQTRRIGLDVQLRDLPVHGDDCGALATVLAKHGGRFEFEVERLGEFAVGVGEETDLKGGGCVSDGCGGGGRGGLTPLLDSGSRFEAQAFMLGWGTGVLVVRDGYS